MPHNVDPAIDLYIGHFRKLVARLRNYELHVEDRLIKKNALVSVLDAISRTTSNALDDNRKRFVDIVSNFGDWHDHTRVSAPHISYVLERLRSPSFGQVREFIAQKIHENSHGGVIPLSCDPEFEEIREIWPVPAEQKVVGRLSLTFFTHLNLFYQYRNSLVHELREPGYGMEFDVTEEEPFYHGMIADDRSSSMRSQTLELVYPINFYFRLTENVISNVERYLRTNSIDPYGAYSFGSSWLGELNT